MLSAAVLRIPPLNLYPVLVLRLFSQDCACMGCVLKSNTGQQQPRWEISRGLLHKVQSFRGFQDILLGEKSLERLVLNLLCPAFRKTHHRNQETSKIYEFVNYLHRQFKSLSGRDCCGTFEDLNQEQYQKY